MPELKIQDDVVLNIENEREAVSSNKGLINSFEQKIKDRIAKVWEE